MRKWSGAAAVLAAAIPAVGLAADDPTSPRTRFFDTLNPVVVLRLAPFVERNHFAGLFESQPGAGPVTPDMTPRPVPAPRAPGLGTSEAPAPPKPPPGLSIGLAVELVQMGPRGRFQPAPLEGHGFPAGQRFRLVLAANLPGLLVAREGAGTPGKMIAQWRVGAAVPVELPPDGGFEFRPSAPLALRFELTPCRADATGGQLRAEIFNALPDCPAMPPTAAAAEDAEQATEGYARIALWPLGDGPLTQRTVTLELVLRPE
jgi:hypothetical protein